MSRPVQDALYLDEGEIARRVMGKNAARWPEVALVEERTGLPKVDPLYGGRYWPAVKAYLDRRHGLMHHDTGRAPDGGENFDGWRAKRAGAEASQAARRSR